MRNLNRLLFAAMLLFMCFSRLQAQKFSKDSISFYLDQKEYKNAENHFKLLDGIPIYNNDVKFQHAFLGFQLYKMILSENGLLKDKYPVKTDKEFKELLAIDSLTYRESKLYLDSLSIIQEQILSKIELKKKEIQQLSQSFINWRAYYTSDTFYNRYAHMVGEPWFEHKDDGNFQCAFAEVCILLMESNASSVIDYANYEKAKFALKRCKELDENNPLIEPLNARLGSIRIAYDEAFQKSMKGEILDQVSLAFRSYKDGDMEKSMWLIDSAALSETFRNDPKVMYFRAYIFKDLWKKSQNRSDYRIKAIESYFKSIELDTNDLYSDDSKKSLRYLGNTIYNEAAEELNSGNYQLADSLFFKIVIPLKKLIYPDFDVEAMKLEFQTYYLSTALSDFLNKEEYDADKGAKLDSICVRLLINDPGNKVAASSLKSIRSLDRLHKMLLLNEAKLENAGLVQEVETVKAEKATLTEEVEVVLAEKALLEKAIGQRNQELVQIYESIESQKVVFKELEEELESKEFMVEAAEMKLEDQMKQVEVFSREYDEIESRMSQSLKLLEDQKLLNYVIVFVALIISILGGIAYKNYRTQKSQAAVIAKQRDEVHEKSEQLQEKNQEITDSIQYAKRIQTAILPPNKLVKQYLDESFILYKPKDIVAGDFYWMESVGDVVYFAAADCTGHGVPGAMVSVICVNGLNRSVREFGLRTPSEILDKTRELVIKEFEKSEEEVKDGMDISLCALNTKTNELQWAGANNPLWIVTSAPLSDRSTPLSSEQTDAERSRSGSGADASFVEVKANKQPIGKYGLETPFTNHNIQLEKGDTIYIFSDGYPDQFGGERGKKYKSGNFKKTLVRISTETIEKQKKMLDQEFESWRGTLEQIDDVCVIGVRV
jgi:serine phosphatase RsbU (regulator of sigma subunit)